MQIYLCIYIYIYTYVQLHVHMYYIYMSLSFSLYNIIIYTCIYNLYINMHFVISCYVLYSMCFRRPDLQSRLAGFHLCRPLYLSLDAEKGPRRDQ